MRIRKVYIVLCIFALSLTAIVILINTTPQPQKTVNRYLSSVQEKKAKEAYDLVYFEKTNLEFERFEKDVINNPLIDYKIREAKKINEGAYNILVSINMNGFNVNQTYEVRNINNHWKIVF